MTLELLLAMLGQSEANTTLLKCLDSDLALL